MISKYVSVDGLREPTGLFEPFDDRLRAAHQPGRCLTCQLAIRDELCELAFRIDGAGEVGVLLTWVGGGHLVSVRIAVLWSRY